MQNAAARLIFDLRKNDHITESLKELHWLPIRSRIEYKIALITYKTLNGDGPAYLQELLTPMQQNRTLRSSKNLLQIPNFKLKSGGKRSFSFADPNYLELAPRRTEINEHCFIQEELKDLSVQKGV